MKTLCYKLTLAHFFVLAVGIFSSISLSALSHVLIFIPGCYFAFEFIKKLDFKKIKMSMYFMDLICFSILLSVVFNWSEIESPLKNLFKVKYFILALLSVFSYRETIKNYLTRKHIQYLVHIFLVVTTFATVYGLVQLYRGMECHPGRACGLYGMTMSYSYGMSLFMVLMTGLILYRDKIPFQINSWFLYGTYALNLWGLYESGARGAWIGLLGAIPFFFFKRDKKMFLISGLLGVLLLLAISFFTNRGREMFFERKVSNNGRVYFYQAAYRAFLEKPVFGYGYRNFEPNVPKIKKRYNIKRPDFGGHAHNNLLEHLASTGIIGFMCLLLWKCYWVVESYRREDFIGKISLPFAVSFIGSGLVQYTFGDGENLFLILSFWALGCASDGINKNF